MIKLIHNPWFCEMVGERALDYAKEYCWENQSQRHFEFADDILQSDGLFTEFPEGSVALMEMP